MPILRENLIALDCEWHHGYVLQMASFWGMKDGKRINITMDKKPEQPLDLSGCDLVYYAAAADVVLLEEAGWITGDYATFDLSILLKLKFNFAKKNFGGEKWSEYQWVFSSLNEVCYGVLGEKMKYKQSKKLRGVWQLSREEFEKAEKTDDFNDLDVEVAPLDDEDKVYAASTLAKAIKRRNREDTRVTYDIAVIIDPYLHKGWKVRYNDKIALRYTRENALRMSAEGKQWFKLVCRNGLPINAEAVALMKDPAERVKIFNRLITGNMQDIYYVKDGNLHLNQKKLEAYLNTVPGLTPSQSNAAYAIDGKAHVRGWQNFKQILENNPIAADRLRPVALLEFIHFIFAEGRVKYLSRSNWTYPYQFLYGQAGGRTGQGGDSLINVGNIARALVKPPEGFAIVSVDVSAEEPAIAADYYQDNTMKEWLDTDIYSRLVKLLDPVYFEQHKILKNGIVRLDKTDKQRVAKKPILLGYLYGMGAYNLANRLGVDHATASSILKKVKQEAFQTFEIRKKDHAAQYMDRGWVSTFDGFTLYVEPPHDYQGKHDVGSNPRQVTNFTIQGTGAVLLRNFVLRYGQNYTIIDTLFDGVYILCPLAEVKEKTAQLCKEIIESFTKDIPSILWKVEPQECQVDGTPYFTKGIYEKPGYIDSVYATFGENAPVMGLPYPRPQYGSCSVGRLPEPATKGDVQ